MAFGPVEWIEIGFPGSKLNGVIGPALKKLVDARTIRIIDLLVLHKDSEGVVTALELESLDPEEAELFDDLDGDVFGLLSEQDMALAGEALAPGSASVLVVCEDLWVTTLAEAVAEAAGSVVGHGRVPDEVVSAALAAASAESGSA